MDETKEREEENKKKVGDVKYWKMPSVILQSGRRNKEIAGVNEDSPVWHYLPYKIGLRKESE